MNRNTRNLVTKQMSSRKSAAPKTGLKRPLPSFKNVLEGMRSGKSMVSRATKSAQAKVYKNAAPTTRMTGRMIEAGMNPKAARKTSYNDALKRIKKL